MTLLDGLYKVEHGINGAFGHSVMCLHDGKMLGGNSAFAHLGSYDVKDGVIEAEIITERHNEDPNFKPLMGADVTGIKVRGRTAGSTIVLEGKADAMPTTTGVGAELTKFVAPAFLSAVDVAADTPAFQL
ncbi:hypothetical protein [Bradyrhizobium sp. AZCC 2230]|uniref:hypothetical protein n=1 Tax=Bradyrhizobium sp. AZCC 2230 TaxID=3117021 RepID=UPI002FF16A6A